VGDGVIFLFFCISKVTEMQSTESRWGPLRLTSLSSLKKWRLLSFWMSFQRCSCFFTFTYSHDLTVKKKASVVSCEIAVCCSIMFQFASSAMMHADMACCCTSFGISFLKTWNRNCKRKLSCKGHRLWLGQISHFL
jgi:hypothetical protein